MVILSTSLRCLLCWGAGQAATSSTCLSLPEAASTSETRLPSLNPAPGQTLLASAPGGGPRCGGHLAHMLQAEPRPGHTANGANKTLQDEDPYREKPSTPEKSRLHQSTRSHCAGAINPDASPGGYSD